MIVFVMGPSCAGKSTFIKKNFPTFKKIDLYDFELENGFSVEGIMQAYEECKNALVKAIKNGEDVVMEHTLLKAIRRDIYIKAVKEITNEPIIAYFICPSDNELKSNAKRRMISFWKDELKNIRDIMELPTTEEGFGEIHIIDKNLYTEGEIDMVLKETFLELYKEVFNEDGTVKNCGRRKCQELITAAMQVETHDDGYFGNDRTGMMNTERIQDLHNRII